ncbi:MAG TPA: hypothetical protein VFD41_04425 [Actinomycetales bacterium]|nr:hypothetical protein [Actinomycetales bacterium]
MIVLALLLLIAVVALVLFILVTGASETVLLESDQLNVSWEPTALVVFLLGAVTLLLAVIALGLLRGGTKRKVEQRRELKRLRKVEKENAAAGRDRPATDPTPATRTQPAEKHTTPAQPTQAAPAQAAPAQGAPPPAPATPAQTPATQAPPTHPTETSSGASREGSWHDDPDTTGADKPTGRHERGL